MAVNDSKLFSVSLISQNLQEKRNEMPRGHSVRHYLERAYFRARGYFPVFMDGHRYKFQPDDRKFWRRVAAHRWEPHTYRILDRFLDSSLTYVDLGAWIGPTVIYAAERCRQVYCFEPDPFAYERLLSNLRMNRIDNVFSFHGAVYTRNGTIDIGNPDGQFGNSKTQTLEDAGKGRPVPCLTFESARKLLGIADVDLFKIDIEGAEFEVLPTMYSYLEAAKPSLYLSTHAPLMKTGERHRKMRAVAELSEIYSYCLDKHLQPLERGALLGPRFTDSFSEVVFTEKNIH